MAWDDEKTDDEGLTPAGRLLASEYNDLVTAVKARVLESLFDANTIIKADSDDTPAALTVDEQRLVGRITAGVITGLTATQVRTLLSVDNVENSKVNLTANVAPTVNEDSDDGYSVLSRWADVTADKEYVCLDATVGAAVWTETTGNGSTITAESFSESVAHLTTDADAGKAFTITSFPAHAQITAIRVRADFTSGQQADTGSALVNNGSGILPAGTAVAYDAAVADFAVLDYIWIDDECMRVSADDGSTLTVVRGLKGTMDAFHDDNATIVKSNHGVRVVLFKDTNKNYSERIIELSSIMTYKGVTDALISANDDYFGLTADIQNLGHNDFLVIEDTADEICRVQNVNHDTVSATYDYTIYVQDDLAAHDTTKDVKKLMVYDLDTPYNSGTTLYGTVFIDEKIAGTVNVEVEVFTDSYT